MDIFPLKNDDSLAVLEAFLEKKDNFKNIVTQLSRIGGSNTKEITKKIMYRVITNEFGQLYSWEGGKGKRKFRDLAITKVIFGAVRCNHRTKDACDDQIIASIKAWLVKAKERINLKKRKLEDSRSTIEKLMSNEPFPVGSLPIDSDLSEMIQKM